jgi:hypothetical protein
VIFCVSLKPEGVCSSMVVCWCPHTALHSTRTQYEFPLLRKLELVYPFFSPFPSLTFPFAYSLFILTIFITHIILLFTTIWSWYRVRHQITHTKGNWLQDADRHTAAVYCRN